MDSRSYNYPRSPPKIDTTAASQARGGSKRDGSNEHHSNRFSYAATPVTMQEPFWDRYESASVQRDHFEDVATPIEEGTWTSTDGYQIQNRDRISHDVYTMSPPLNSNAPAALGSVRRTASPFADSDLRCVHPNSLAPAAESRVPQGDIALLQSMRENSPLDFSYRPHQAYRPQAVQDSPVHQSQQSERPLRAQERFSQLHEAVNLPIHHTSVEPKKSPTFHSEHVQVPYSPNQPLFTPGAYTGPNSLDPDMHQPGQIPHPNMQMTEYTGDTRPWLNTLCSCSTDVGTCMTGFFCPCILDSRTSYRMQQRSQRKDPTDLLAYETCNMRCGVFAAFGICGLCCLLPLTLRTRIRHAYKLQGNFCSDVLQSCCCCCCVAIQNEREIRDREVKMRQNAGPATQYASSPQTMTYTQGGGF